MAKPALFIYLFIISFGLLSCNNRRLEEKDAENRLLKIEQFINEDAFHSAKSEIDSVHILYPRMVEKRRRAQAFMDTIVRRESARTIIYCDSVLEQKRKEFEKIEQNFKLEKDEKYQEIGNFVHRMLGTEQNSGRIYLKVYVDEQANLYFTSHYCGTKLGHTQINIAYDKFFVETAVVSTSNPSNYNFTNEGQLHEMVTFGQEDAVKVAEFITIHADKQLKITLKGEKIHVYYLSKQDKQSIVDSYDFWIIKRDIVQLEKEIKQAATKIAHIKQRYSKETSTN